MRFKKTLITAIAILTGACSVPHQDEKIKLTYMGSLDELPLERLYQGVHNASYAGVKCEETVNAKVCIGHVQVEGINYGTDNGDKPPVEQNYVITIQEEGQRRMVISNEAEMTGIKVGLYTATDGYVFPNKLPEYLGLDYSKEVLTDFLKNPLEVDVTEGTDENKIDSIPEVMFIPASAMVFSSVQELLMHFEDIRIKDSLFI